MRIMKSFVCSLLLLFSFAANAANIVLEWGAPTTNEDGTAIGEIEGYTIYQTINNVAQAPVLVDALALNYQFSDVVKGSHIFQITTRANGLESQRSEPVTISVDHSRPVKIELTVRVIE